MNNTFPKCESSYAHEKKHFKKFNKTFQTEIELEIEIFKNNKTITNYFKSKPKTKDRSEWYLYLSQHLLIPNLIGSAFYLLFCYVDSNLPCEDKLGLTLLKIVYNSVLWNFFWSLVGYYLTIFEYLYSFKVLESLIFLYVLQVLTGILYSYILCKFYRIPYQEVKIFFNICLTYFLIAFLNKYFVQDYLILTLNENKFFEDKKIYFKLMIFIYFQLYRNLANYLVRKFCIISKFYDASMIFLKVVIIDLITNSIIPIVVAKNSRKLEIFYVGLFTYHLSIFYFKKSFLAIFMEKIKRFILSQKKAKNDITIYDRKFNKLFNEFIAISVMI